AFSQKRSLSRLIESYLKSLINMEIPKSDDEIEISPFVESLRSGIKMASDYDYKKDYSDHLMEKYR
ncbi:MAG: DUF6364 family protein, partial [Bacteroidota bacterium]